MTLSEKAAYLKGLMDGLKLDTEKDENKVLAAVVDMLSDIAENVADFQLKYLIGNRYFDPSAIADADWVRVEAVRVTLQLEGTDPGAIGGDPAPLRREFTTTITLRSRIL